MEIVQVREASWDAFLAAIAAVRARYEFYVDPVLLYRKRNTILFRGQPDASYPLSTTLERRIGPDATPFHVLQYLEYATRYRNEIESITGTKWPTPGPFHEMEEAVRAGQHASWVDLPAYDYMVYLRHHGFPSPLLDWTESPFVAAYFAFIDSKDESPAVFCFVDQVGGGKGATVGEPVISQHGKYITTDPRHFAQKAWYTTCTCRDERNQRDYFRSHEDALARSSRSQDVLIDRAFAPPLRGERTQDGPSDSDRRIVPRDGARSEGDGAASCYDRHVRLHNDDGSTGRTEDLLSALVSMSSRTRCSGRGIYAMKDTYISTALTVGVNTAWLEAQTGVR